MNLRLLKIFSLLIGLSFGVSAFASDDDSSRKSSSLPAITVKDVDGAPVNFAEYIHPGQLTVVSFWATWCKPCLVELGNMDNLYEDWKKNYNVRIIAVSIDDSRTAPKVKPYVTSKNWTFDILLDLNSNLRRAMNVTNPPTTFLLDKTGKVVFTHTGYLEGDEAELEEKIKEYAGH